MYRSEKGEQRHEEAGPLPGDGFMGESPAPRQAVLTQTPLQDRQRPKNEQVCHSYMQKFRYAVVPPLHSRNC